MKRARPYFKKSHQSWYVNLHGKPYRLGTDEQQAWIDYHKLMAGVGPVSDRTPAATLLDKFLVWTKENREPATYAWYHTHVRSFADFIGSRISINDVTPNNVTSWLGQKYKGRSDTYRNGAVRAVFRGFSWAKKERLIRSNPIDGVDKPACEPREAYLQPGQWEQLLGAINTTDPFYDFVVFLRETGCRPQEARIVETRHWDRDNHRLILDLKQSKGIKGRRKKRVIRLTENAEKTVARLAANHATGTLFRNTNGNAWKAYAINNRFHRLGEKLGFEVSAYWLRHTFATDALLRGVDPITVSILMGHKDATMISRVYQHLTQNESFLREKLERATRV
jgi:integrase